MMDTSQSSIMGSNQQPQGGQQAKTKRLRTSFKHHQLRMLKSYFATNHNPDAKDLKQLSQKTTLSKRVLQVPLNLLTLTLPRASRVRPKVVRISIQCPKARRQ